MSDSAPPNDDATVSIESVPLGFGVKGVLTNIGAWIYGIASFAWSVPCGVLTLLFLAPFRIHYGWMNFWSWLWLKIFMVIYRVHVVVDGRENLEPGRAYVVVSNHRSWMDAMAILTEIWRQVRLFVVVKRTLLWIPFFGQWMSGLGFVGVHRGAGNKDKVERAAEGVRAGKSVLVFAEGTRTPTHQFQKFKKGAALISRAAETPILPLVVSGTGPIFPRGTPFVRPGRVRLEILPPVDPAQFDSAEAMTRYVESIILDRYRLTADSPPAIERPALRARLAPPAPRPLPSTPT